MLVSALLAALTPVPMPDVVIEEMTPTAISVASAQDRKPWAVSRKNTSSVCTPVHLVRSRPAM